MAWADGRERAPRRASTRASGRAPQSADGRAVLCVARRLLGWAAARMDDLLNLAPARLTALLIALPGGVLHHWRDIKSEDSKQSLLFSVDRSTDANRLNDFVDLVDDLVMIW